MPSDKAGISMAQAEWVKKLLFQNGRLRVIIEGPISDTGAVQVKYRGVGEEWTHQRTVYLDRNAAQLVWDASENRPAA